MCGFRLGLVASSQGRDHFQGLSYQTDTKLSPPPHPVQSGDRQDTVIQSSGSNSTLPLLKDAHSTFSHSGSIRLGSTHTYTHL